MSHTQVSAASVKRLSGLKLLQNLGLAFCKLGDQGIKDLPAFPLLTDLYIDDCGISDNSFAVLAEKYPHLVHLNVASSKKTGHDGLSSFCRFKDLRELNVSGVARSARELKVLSASKSLKKLIIAGSPADAKEAGKGLPHCEIVAVPMTKHQNPDGLPNDLFAPLR
jgi:hypothetical protein